MANLFCLDCEELIVPDITMTGRCGICGGRRLVTKMPSPTTTTTPQPSPRPDNNNTTTTGVLLERLLQLLGGAAGTSRPAARKAVATLRRIKVTTAGLDPQIALVIPGIDGTLVGIPASFGMPFHRTTTAPLICAVPPTLRSPLINAQDFNNTFVLCERGDISFANKANIAAMHGAKGLIIIQTKGGTWPFVASDSANEANAQHSIPVVTVSYENGTVLRRRLAEAVSPVMITVCRMEKEERICPICHDSLEQVSDLLVLQMPCLHYFHEACVLKWLEEKATCPTCRFPLPEEGGNDTTITSEHDRVASMIG